MAMPEMEQVEAVFTAMRQGRLVLRREAVCSVTQPRRVLYEECLARVRGMALSPAQFIPLLERFSMVCAFDRYVMRQAVALLRGEPAARLGVNLSALSMLPGVMWEALFRQLAEQPEVAGRLVVEITESARMDVALGGRFVRQLRQLGCGVAVDDFGVGYGVETAVSIQSPDIIKIDASLLAGARCSGAGQARLAGMVRLAADLAPQVVVEGVEGEADLELVRAAGAQWVQGWLFSPVRPV
ncbi:EAL domain-containing protein [Paraburkholderia kururiensis]|uniref:EAL domain-containing protein n=1 Tax=Paraburkholderia kururiensis TaxID=984307 RepID=UPI00138763D9|nr:EAL domain-containing protein [Paraburkholderia kururiensis]